MMEQPTGCQPLLNSGSEGDGTKLLVATTGNLGAIPKQMCEFCVEDNAAVATHECDGCGGALLCSEHASQHPNKKPFPDHAVKALSNEQRAVGLGGGRHETLLTRCLLHTKNAVVTFCKTCSHGACVDCLAAGHENHIFSPLCSVAEDQLSVAIKAAESFSESVLSATQPNGSGKVPPPQAVVDKIHQEAEAACLVVTDTFDRVDAIIQQKRHQLLHEIEMIQLKQLDAWESKQQRLYGLLESYNATLTQLVRCSTGSKMGEADGIGFSGVLVANLAKMLSDLELEKRSPLLGKITAATTADVFGELEKQVQALVHVTETCPADVRKATLTLPNDIYPDKQSTIHLTFPTNTIVATLSLVVKISSPSGHSHVVSLDRAPDSSSAGLIMLATFTPTEVGQYSMETCDAAGNMKTASFECRPAPIAFDRDRSSQLITLTNNNCMATHVGKTIRRGTVVANRGYTVGRHSWNVRLHNAFAGGYHMLFGVCALPDDHNFDNIYRFFNNKRCHYWKASGESRVNGEPSGHDCRRLNDSDTITLTLDCQHKTLEIHHHLTGERYIMPGVICDKPLYPAFCFRHPGVQAEIF